MIKIPLGLSFVANFPKITSKITNFFDLHFFLTLRPCEEIVIDEIFLLNIGLSNDARHFLVERTQTDVVVDDAVLD